MQKIQVIGNIVRDAVIRESNGRKAINFVIAYNESYKNKEGVKVEKAIFYSCTLWRDAMQPTAVVQYLTKGVKVFVEGSPSSEMYKTKENVTAIDNRINVKQIELLTFLDKDKTTNESKPANTESQAAIEQPEGVNIDADDLPF